MELSSELVSQFAKLANSNKETKPANVGVQVEGTARLYDEKIYVQLDGSDQLTPIISSTTGMKDGDRVTVLIKDHSATVTGNASSPSATQGDLNDTKTEIGNQIAEFEIVIADKVDTIEFNAEKARIDNLVAENVTIKDRLAATEADIDDLTADNVTINEKLTAAEADIDNLTATKLDVEIANANFATIQNLEATNADIHNLEVDYGSFKQTTTDTLTAHTATINNLDATYAKIDFANIGEAAVENLFAKSGIIEDLVVSEGHITGELVGVTIKGDLIEGNTIKADKLVVLGSDGLYYKLNVNAETVGAEQTEYNSLNGSIITANTITAEKINVDDLVAFNATIGGYHITSDSLYSGLKSSATNADRGVFMNDDGEFAVGDSSNYLRFFKDTDGTYKLELSANSIKMSASNTTIEEEINNIKNDVANTGKLIEKSCGEIVNIGENGGKTPYSLTVKGNTRQNLWENPAGTSNGVTVTSNGDGLVTLSGTTTTESYITTGQSFRLRPGTVYTLSIDKAIDGISGDEGFYVGFRDSGGSSVIPSEGVTYVGYESKLSKTFTVPGTSDYCIFGFRAEAGRTYSSTYRVMLNEGSEAQPWCPPGLNGVDELSVVVAGKNLMPNGVWELGTIDAETGSQGTAGIEIRSGYIPIVGGETYVFSSDKRSNLQKGHAYDANKKYIGLFYTGLNSLSPTPCVMPAECSFIRVVLTDTDDFKFTQALDGGMLVDANIQLELGSTATEYEPPQVTVTPIDLAGHTLNSLPDGTYDELRVDFSGNVTLVQRVGTKVLPVDASSWSQDASYSSLRYRTAISPPALNPYGGSDTIMCDALYPRNDAEKDPGYSGTNIAAMGSNAFATIGSGETAQDIADVCGGRTLLYELASPQEIALSPVTLPALPAESANVWVSTSVSASICMEYWTVEGAKVLDAQNAANDVSVGARNLIRNSTTMIFDSYILSGVNIPVSIHSDNTGIGVVVENAGTASVTDNKLTFSDASISYSEGVVTVS